MVVFWFGFGLLLLWWFGGTWFGYFWYLMSWVLAGLLVWVVAVAGLVVWFSDLVFLGLWVVCLVFVVGWWLFTLFDWLFDGYFDCFVVWLVFIAMINWFARTVLVVARVVWVLLLGCLWFSGGLFVCVFFCCVSASVVTSVWVCVGFWC